MDYINLTETYLYFINEASLSDIFEKAKKFVTNMAEKILLGSIEIKNAVIAAEVGGLIGLILLKSRTESRPAIVNRVEAINFAETFEGLTARGIIDNLSQYYAYKGAFIAVLIVLMATIALKKYKSKEKSKQHVLASLKKNMSKLDKENKNIIKHAINILEKRG